MTFLSTKPGSSKPAQRSRLVVLGKRKGFDLDQIRSMVGGSVRALSADAASGWIKHWGGGDLPNPPGQKPSPYAGKKKQPGTVRMITEDHVDQIANLLGRYFEGDMTAALAWLAKDFKVTPPTHPVMSLVEATIRQLGTAERGGQVIRVLKQMLARREQ